MLLACYAVAVLCPFSLGKHSLSLLFSLMFMFMNALVLCYTECGSLRYEEWKQERATHYALNFMVGVGFYGLSY